MDVYEVTNKLYETCVDAGVCTSPQSEESNTRFSFYGNSQYDNYPVIYVNWNQARTYCQWRDASLPTEAQWEKAARGTDGRTYPWGDYIDCTLANYNGDACKNDTSEVGAYKGGASIYGIFDMAGHGWEWVNSRYGPYPYTNTDGRENTADWDRVWRGGSWFSKARDVRTTFRSYEDPKYVANILGFRCAKDVP